jgi:hypothetical protein
VHERVARPIQDKNHMSHFLSTLEFIPVGKQSFHSLWGSREVSRENEKIETQFPRLGMLTRISPAQKRGRKKGVTSESGFRKGPRKEAASSLWIVARNQEMCDCKPSSVSPMYHSESKAWGYLTFEPQIGQPPATQKSEYKK